MKQEPIRIERTFHAPVSKVWQALTNPLEMKKWYFDLPDFKAEKGAKFQFYGGPSPEKQYLHLCVVTEVEYEKKITYSWRYDGYPGNSFVTFNLTKNGDNTTLHLIHSDIETFAEDNPDFAKSNFVEGWTAIVHTSLKNYLEGASNQTI